MGTTFKYAPRRLSTESGGNPPDDERPTHSVAAEDVFDDPNILSELNEANASLADWHDAAPRRPVPARLPLVDAFDFDEACRTNDFEEAHRAKSLAHRLGPQDHSSGRDRGRWRFPSVRNGKKNGTDADWRESMQDDASPRGSKRAFFWGFCTSLTIVVAAPVVFGIVGAPDESPPATISDSRNDNDQAGTNLAAQDDPATEIEAAHRLSNETVVIRNQPAAAAIIAPATTAFAAPLVRPAEPEGGSVVGEQSEPPAAAPTAATGADNLVPAPQPVDSRAEVPAPPPEPEPQALPDDDDFTQMAQSQLSAKADPSEMEVVKEPASESLPAAEQPDLSPLSDEQIEQLLARGEELLRNGDIASARLLFLHVAAAGDRRGAKAVGMTYDPNVYARLPVMGLKPDPEQAQLWYGKAGADLSYTIDLAPLDTSAQSEVSEDESELAEWNAACARKYKSFEPSTGLYTALSGTKRRCQLP
jgi:hypothetical protein